MKKVWVLLAVFLFSSVIYAGGVMAEGDKWHNFSEDKNPHANGGCASKGKIAQFHKFHPKSGRQVRVPNVRMPEADKTSKVPSLDQFI